MRQAEADDAIRRLGEKAAVWPLRLKRLVFGSYAALGKGEIPIALPVTVLCGYCGAGKSTVLRLIWAILDPKAASADSGAKRKVGAGDASLEYVDQGVEKSAELHWADKKFVGDGVDEDVIYLDSGEILSLTRTRFPPDADIEPTLDGTSAFMLEDKELERVNYLVRREYDGIEVYEIEFSDVTVPFFRASYNGVAYDSRTMGSGELSLLYVWWALKIAKNNAFILIEEPESFASAASQRALVEHMAQVALQKKLTIIATSHSPSIILRLPDDSVRFLVREKSGVRYEQKPRPELQARLGIFPDRELNIYVEDEVASYLARAWLGAYGDGIIMNASIEAAAGTSDVIGRVAALPRDLPRQRFLGLLDGDARGEKLGKASGAIGFLPSLLAPEQLLRAGAIENSVKIGEVYQVDFSQVLQAAEGLDLHDWLEEVVKSLGISKQRVVELLFEMWSSNENNQKVAIAAAVEFVEVASKIMA